MNDQGIIYVASQSLGIVCEAIASAESAKERLPDVSISLLTDMPALVGTSIEPFDRVMAIDAPLPEGSDAAGAWGRGLQVRVLALVQSPYEKTLFLDSDTRILSAELARIFDDLDEHAIAMAACTPASSLNCQMLGPMFAAGVIVYRRDERVHRLFKAWAELQGFHLELAAREPIGDVPYLSKFSPAEKWFLLVNDQTSLSRLLSPCHNQFEIPVKVLDQVWNARGRPRDRLDGVIVDHANCHKVEPHQVRSFLAARGLSVPRAA